MSLEGRVALVAGASRGIGAATARTLAGASADVAVGYGSDQEAAERIAGEISAPGYRAVAVGGDLANSDEVECVAGEVESSLGPVDILVSSAGIGPRQSLEEITVEDWDRVMAVNRRPAFLFARRLAPGMRERGGVGSCSSLRSPPLPGVS